MQTRPGSNLALPMQSLPDQPVVDRVPLSPAWIHGILFALILALGIFARTWEWGNLPPSLNPDEASNGVDALSVYRYGVDRSGVSLPVKFVSWGGGQDALYGYLLIPLVAISGLTPAIVRLPMLIFGILAMPMIYAAATATWNAQVGLLAMFFLAISPWHILLSRWSLEANLFPFLFLAAYTCMLAARGNAKWFIAGCALLGLCLYAYGTAYAVVPVFLLGALAMLSRRKVLRSTEAVVGILLFAALAAPIALLLVVNGFGLPDLHLGSITVLRFPVEPRYEAATVIGSRELLGGVATNLWTAIRLVVTQSDGILYNGVDPYGYFYRYSFPFALLGLCLAAYSWRRERRLESGLLMLWMGAALLVPVFQAVNINRFNIIFIPLLLCMAYAVYWLDAHLRGVLPVCVLLLLAGFIAFTVAYHGESYRRQIDWKFDAGLLPALTFVGNRPQEPVCVTDKINMPYIFVLFTEQTPPADFLDTVQYVDAEAPLRQVRAFGRYIFGTENCPMAVPFTYVLTSDEVPPRLGNRYQYRFFDNFVVYYPKP